MNRRDLLKSSGAAIVLGGLSCEALAETVKPQTQRSERAFSHAVLHLKGSEVSEWLEAGLVHFHQCEVFLDGAITNTGPDLFVATCSVFHCRGRKDVFPWRAYLFECVVDGNFFGETDRTPSITIGCYAYNNTGSELSGFNI